jgi:hypothetical protein
LQGSGNDRSIPNYVDEGYPRVYRSTDRWGGIDATFVMNGTVYFFAGTEYYRLDAATVEPDEGFDLGKGMAIAGSWGNLPLAIRTAGLDAALRHVDRQNQVDLYLIQGNTYIKYNNINDRTEAKPYEIDRVPYDVIRLTSSTAEQLNQLLFAGGIKRLLQLSTQEMNESPTISKALSQLSTQEMNESPTISKAALSPEKNISMAAHKFAREPINSHLDFDSANGIYYWEIFFHAPFLIAQRLNADQQFESAKQWYEHIFDPTEVSDYWKFLPFLAADPDALMSSLGNALAIFEFAYKLPAAEEAQTTVTTARAAWQSLKDKLADYQNIFLGLSDLTQFEQGRTDTLANIESWAEFVRLDRAIQNLQTVDTSLSFGDRDRLSGVQRDMQEVMEIIKKLSARIDLMNNYEKQLAVYLNDPFDPHAIATLRPLAYRKAIVMSYIDNLLDWGDMLFRQYTPESIQEARMLYILAHDLLGEKPQNMGRVVLEPTKAYKDLPHYTGDEHENYDFLIDLENMPQGTVVYEPSLSFAATQFDTITNPYFFIKENDLFTEYWNRVEDRLAKIRACLNFDGVAQPLPLFQPPIDPAALVNAAAAGGIAAAAALAGSLTGVPDYRFDVLMTKARDLVGKLKNFSDMLLGALEKQDSEELSLLQSQQDEMMLNLVTLLKDGQIKEADESLQNLKESKKRAEDQRQHYQNLIQAGPMREEITQLSLMAAGAALQGAVALARIASGLSYVTPQFTMGPFSFGVTAGGQNIGAMMDQFAEGVQTGGEALSMGGETAGIVAQFKRSKQEWELQKRMAESEIIQLDFQIASQQRQIELANRELLMHQKEIENNRAIDQFMKSRFSTLELYSWMSSKTSSLFFETFKLAHDYAKQAEQAFIFEKGLQSSKVNYVSGMNWNSQRKGLLSGISLELELDRMEKAYAETDSRRLEITKNISLLEMNPLALLALKNQGVCTFRLSEELFDYDFPGHYNRQIKSIALAFDIGEGKSVNATLTQLSSKLVMDTDLKAVKHLIDPAHEPTPNVRANWRPNQQVALSHVDQYTENSGLFELDFGDDRYLPFEGTGAVSEWRLELNGKKGAYNPADLLDVTIKLRYTAKPGGSRFANEVKGILKPYNATSFFDLAYNFPDEWLSLTSGDESEVTFSLSRDMFPNMSSNRIIGLLMQYQYNGSSNGNGNGNGGAIFTINGDLTVPNNTYLQPSTLNIGQPESEWNFSLKGDGSTLKNAEMVLVYKAKV